MLLGSIPALIWSLISLLSSDRFICSGFFCLNSRSSGRKFISGNFLLVKYSKDSVVSLKILSVPSKAIQEPERESKLSLPASILRDILVRLLAEYSWIETLRALLLLLSKYEILIMRFGASWKKKLLPAKVIPFLSWFTSISSFHLFA